MKQNWGRLFDEKLAELRKTGARPRLLLHACCAPCSSHCLEVLAECFDITVFFYNPNISPEKEFAFRLSELNRFLKDADYSDVSVLAPPYDPAPFLALARGLESLPEGGERCRRCYELRLRRTAKAAPSAGAAIRTGMPKRLGTTVPAAWCGDVPRRARSRAAVQGRR